MEEKNKAVLKLMKTQIKLSQYNLKQKLKLVIDGARTAGTRFMLIQNINDAKPDEDIKIINACSLMIEITVVWRRRQLLSTAFHH